MVNIYTHYNIIMDQFTAVPYCIKCGNLVWFWDVTGTRPHEERVNIGFGPDAGVPASR